MGIPSTPRGTLTGVPSQIRTVDELRTGGTILPILRWGNPIMHRPTRRVTAFDEDGESVEMVGTGLLARCLQHETDHLNGIVFGDRLSGRARKKLFSLHEDAADLYPGDWPVRPRADNA